MSEYGSDHEEVFEEQPEEETPSVVDEEEEAPEESEEPAEDEEADDEPKDDDAEADDAEGDDDADEAAGEDEDDDGDDDKDAEDDDAKEKKTKGKSDKKADPAKKTEPAKKADKPKSLYVKPAKQLSRREQQSAQKDYLNCLEEFLDVTTTDIQTIVDVSTKYPDFKLSENALTQVLEKTKDADEVTEMFRHIKAHQLELIEYYRVACQLHDQVESAKLILESCRGLAIKAPVHAEMLTAVDQFPAMLQLLSENREFVLTYLKAKCNAEKSESTKTGKAGRKAGKARVSRLAPKAKPADHETAAYFQVILSTESQGELAETILASNIKF